MLRRVARQAVTEVFKSCQRIGVNVTPNHYYVPLADVHQLRKTTDVWAKPSAMLGIDVDLPRQIEFLRKTCLPFQDETRGNPHFRYATEKHFGPGYGYIEAQALHGIIRSIKPRRIIEVGSGVSTYCMLQALALNKQETGADCTVICVEPYPSEPLRGLGVQIEQRFVETLSPDFFGQLEAGDVLFIDSSHAVRVGGDVLYLYLDALPSLKPGVHVHVHDIYFPYQHSPDILDTYRQWCETAMLQAVLQNNDKLAITTSLSLLHHKAPEELKQVFPEYIPQALPAGLADPSENTGPGGETHFPASTWLVTS